MSHSFELKKNATMLRKKGFSLTEISEQLSISKSTASVWLSYIELSLQAQKRLEKKRILGQYKTVLLKRKVRIEQKQKAEEKAITDIWKLTMSQELWKLFCALLWWCEGNKDTSMIRFTSSDASLIQNFLYTLRSGFSIDESKFRALVHLHTYHDNTLQRRYWSKTTGIPLQQFHASFQKKNTGIRTKEDYQGCVAISYYDAKIAKELEALYNAFTLSRGVR